MNANLLSLTKDYPEQMAVIKELCLSDNMILRRVIPRYPEVVSLLARYIHKENRTYTQCFSELFYEPGGYWNHGVILDIVGFDETENVLDLYEMQDRLQDMSMERLASYGNILQVCGLNKGEKYTDRPKIRVTCILDGDFLENGKGITRNPLKVRIGGKLFNPGYSLVIVNRRILKKRKTYQFINDFFEPCPERIRHPLLRKIMDELKTDESEVLAMCKELDEYGNRKYMEGETKGKQKGRKEGREEEATAVAERMFRSGMDLSTVSQFVQSLNSEALQSIFSRVASEKKAAAV